MQFHTGLVQLASMKGGVSPLPFNSSPQYFSALACPLCQIRKLPYFPQLVHAIDPCSPRWLLEKGCQEEAQKALVYLRGAEDRPEDIQPELQDIKQNIESNNSITEASWSELFTNPDLFARLWRGALLQFMAQMCGATAIKYYLPTVFLALGLSKDLSLMASGIESTLKIGCTIIEMLIIDKLGRKKTLLLGCLVMSLAMIVSLNSYHFISCLTDMPPDQRRPSLGLPK
jgi:hypothetical protein